MLQRLLKCISLSLIAVVVCGTRFAIADPVATGSTTHFIDCEGDSHCVNRWAFKGVTGSADLIAGNPYALSIKHFDQQRVVITRRDSSGFTGVYIGKIQAEHPDLVAGTFWWRQNSALKSAPWYALMDNADGSFRRSPAQMEVAFAAYTHQSPTDIGEVNKELPEAASADISSAMPDPFLGRGSTRFLDCEGDSQCVNRWAFHGGTGSADAKYGNPYALSVVHFDRQQVVITRRDSSGFSGVYVGKMQAEHPDIVTGRFWWRENGSLKSAPWYALMANDEGLFRLSEAKMETAFANYFHQNPIEIADVNRDLPQTESGNGQSGAADAALLVFAAAFVLSSASETCVVHQCTVFGYCYIQEC